MRIYGARLSGPLRRLSIDLDEADPLSPEVDGALSRHGDGHVRVRSFAHPDRLAGTEPEPGAFLSQDVEEDVPDDDGLPGRGIEKTGNGRGYHRFGRDRRVAEWTRMRTGSGPAVSLRLQQYTGPGAGVVGTGHTVL